MTKNISRINFRSNVTLKFLRYLSQFFFKDVKYYLQTGMHSVQTLPYPCTVLVNNVEERDILLVGFLAKLFRLKARLYFPVQRNLPEREFPFETKSTWKKIIKAGILHLSLIPICLRLVGGKYLKKDLFNLLRTIRRSTSVSIYEKFESFKNQIAKRKTFVFFGSELGIGEGDLENTSGILRMFNKKNPDMNYIQITLTYDYLLSKEGIVHISHGGLFQMKPEKTISSIAATLKLKRALSTTVTPGNLFAFGIYSPEVQSGVSRHYLFYKMERLANVIYREKICNISRECLEMSYDELFAEILYNAKQEEFIKYEKETKQYYGTNKLYYFKKTKYTKQENIYRYHYMQLALFHKKFRQIWTEIEVYD
ncbi:MAG: hypothetical protein KBA66_01060 [Leptospiraceae bacterium]|nr:hypothetical protein [Leptospiraceae bacterium]